jgi:hypothetical protein
MYSPIRMLMLDLYKNLSSYRKGIKMQEPVALRVLELDEGEFVVQFEGGIGTQWTTFSDVFTTREEAEQFLKEQADSADYS